MSYSNKQLDNIYFFPCFQRTSYQATSQSNLSQYTSKGFFNVSCQAINIPLPSLSQKRSQIPQGHALILANFEK